MFKKVFLFYINNQHSEIPRLTVLILFLGFFEFLGIGLFLPLLSESDNILNTILNNTFLYVGIQRSDLTILFIIFSMFFLKLVAVIVFNKRLTFNMNFFVFNVRNDIVQKLSQIKFQKIQSYKIGELNNIVTKESERISEDYTYVLDLILKTVLTVIYISLSLLTNVFATFFAIFLGGLFIFGFKKKCSSIKNIFQRNAALKRKDQ